MTYLHILVALFGACAGDFISKYQCRSRDIWTEFHNYKSSDKKLCLMKSRLCEKAKATFDTGNFIAMIFVGALFVCWVTRRPDREKLLSHAIPDDL
jgi:hypothetical protein